MTIAFACPYCRKPGKLAAASVGKKVRCQWCGGKFRTNDPGRQPEIASQPAPVLAICLAALAVVAIAAFAVYRTVSGP